MLKLSRLWSTPKKLATFSLVAFGVCLLILAPAGFVSANYEVSNLSNSLGHSLNQRIIQSNGSTYFVWTDTGEQSNDTGQIHFRTSNDNGNRFSDNFEQCHIWK